jgi:hypothetical protein
MKLYRGSRLYHDILYPQPLLEADKYRFPDGVESVVFATDHPIDATLYAMFSQSDLGGSRYYQDLDGTWKVSIPMTRAELAHLGETEILVYEINDEDGRFKKPVMGNEFYATEPIIPTGYTVRKIKDVLAEWANDGTVEFQFTKPEREIERLKG